jgi:hypothetical protein
MRERWYDSSFNPVSVVLSVALWVAIISVAVAIIR